MRHAFQIAYDGSRYFGFVRQPDRPTVEAELLKVFKDQGLYRDLRGAKYRVAARTDRGVSAMGQVVALDVLGEPKLRELNTALPEDIAVLAIAEVKPDFNPRTQAQSKHYRYVCGVPPGFDLSTVQRAVKLFEGEHDFKHFCKREHGRPTTGKMEFAGVRGQKGTLVFDFVARMFFWQQVRRMVSALLDLGTGKLGTDELKLMIGGRAKQSARPAPAEGLFLLNVRYPSLTFSPDARAVSEFVKHLRTNLHPASEAMIALLEARI